MPPDHPSGRIRASKAAASTAAPELYCLAANRVARDVDAVPAGRLADRGGEPRIAMVERDGGAKVHAGLALLLRPRGRDHPRAPGERDVPRVPNPSAPAAAWTSTRSPACTWARRPSEKYAGW